MIERGVDVSYETIRRWVEKFGSTFAKRIKSRSESPSPVWHFNTKAATRLLCKLLTKQDIKPTRIVTDRLASYGAALKDLGLKHLQDVGSRKNNRAECSHVPIRRLERKSQRFRSVRNTQMLLSAHGQFYNLFNHRRHLISRKTLRKFRQQAQNEWNLVTASVCA